MRSLALPTLILLVAALAAETVPVDPWIDELRAAAAAEPGGPAERQLLLLTGAYEDLLALPERPDDRADRLRARLALGQWPEPPAEAEDDPVCALLQVLVPGRHADRNVLRWQARWRRDPESLSIPARILLARALTDTQPQAAFEILQPLEEAGHPGISAALAAIALRCDDQGEALRALRSGLDRSPAHPQLRYAAARVALAEGQLAAVRRHLAVALQTNPRHRPSALLQARLALAAGDHRSAATALDRVESCYADPASQALRQVLSAAIPEPASVEAAAAARIHGAQALASGAVDRAAAWFDRLVALAPDDWRSHAWQALAAWQRGAIDACLDHCERAFRADDYQASVLDLLEAVEQLQAVPDEQRKTVGSWTWYLPLEPARIWWPVVAPEAAAALDGDPRRGLVLLGGELSIGRAVEALWWRLGWPPHPGGTLVLQAELGEPEGGGADWWNGLRRELARQPDPAHGDLPAGLARGLRVARLHLPVGRGVRLLQHRHAGGQSLPDLAAALAGDSAGAAAVDLCGWLLVQDWTAAQTAAFRAAAGSPVERYAAAREVTVAAASAAFTSGLQTLLDRQVRLVPLTDAQAVDAVLAEADPAHERLLAAAETAFGAQRYDDVRRLLDRLPARDPDGLWFRARLARSAFGDLTEATRLLTVALEQEPTHVRSLWLGLAIARSQQDWQLALAFLGQLPDGPDPDALLAWTAARLHAAAGEPARAAAACDRALAEGPEVGARRWQLARQAASTRDWPATIAHCRAVLRTRAYHRPAIAQLAEAAAATADQTLADQARALLQWIADATVQPPDQEPPDEM